MISVRLYKRRKLRCQLTTLWCSAMIVVIMGVAGTWIAGWGGLGSGYVVPAMDLGEPDVPRADAVSLPLNGDGMLDTPGFLMKLVPALAQEATGAVERGDARETFRQFFGWIASGEALHSGPFWLFWSIIGIGVIAVACCSLVNHYLERRHGLQARAVGGPSDTAPADDAEHRPSDE